MSTRFAMHDFSSPPQDAGRSSNPRSFGILHRRSCEPFTASGAVILVGYCSQVV